MPPLSTEDAPTTLAMALPVPSGRMPKRGVLEGETRSQISFKKPMNVPSPPPVKTVS